MNVIRYFRPSQIPALYTLSVAGIIFISALIGSLSRPDEMSMTIFWPANAILIALMFRYPQRSAFPVWVAAVGGYLLSNYVMGEPPQVNVMMTMANLSGVIAAWWLYTRVFSFGVYLKSRYSVLHLFILCIISSVVSAIFGAIVMEFVLDKPFFLAMIYWFSGDLSSMVAFLPVALAFPEKLVKINRKLRLYDFLPLIMVVFSVAMIFVLGGPGAIAFPVLALIWCALTYSYFVNTVIVMFFVICLFACEVLGLLPLFSADEFVGDTISFRLGVTILVLAPLVVASMNDARSRLIRKLDHAVNYDHLTNVLSRKAFEQRGEQLLSSPHPDQNHLAFLMMDLDYFKRVNDQFGHQGGDELLVHFAKLVQDIIPPDCLCGRMGGEEFAAFIPGSSCERASSIAERIRHEVSHLELNREGENTISTTVSIGVACVNHGSAKWEELMEMADKALYQAKHQGRNQVRYFNC
ncbi:putative diguanylate cyclase YedQ [Vibrio aerogenes CECT 7868]|uniref:diguanylate cyclase n=1 Tax=Vibrio aerogenes CECT 7868 TaxID=1216006 RepID=A0A1M6ALR6_9VIBR|nr:GGDEF domain-containing protein [Vibrio aerogenes]SHI37357.1 putative diguanylate cyclase YedQ [Vibrio aerogenes CECT 7868]